MTHWLIAAMAVCGGAGRATATDGYPVTMHADRYIRAKGVCVVGDLIRLERPVGADRDGVVALEAEMAASIDLQDRGRRIGVDPNGSGHAYIRFVSRAEYPFVLERAAVLKTWYRVYFPFTASWNHSETMDGAGENIVVDSKNDQPAGRWLWLPGPVYRLGKGEHRLRLNNYNGGVRLDRIVLVPEGRPAPTGQGPLPAWSQAPRTGRIETTGLIPRDIRRWDRFAAHVILRGGRVDVLWSRDLGRTWHPVGPDGDLRAVPVVKDKYNGLKVRYVLTAAPDGRTPIVQFPTVRYIGPPPTVLANGRVSLSFAPGGELLGIRDRVLGRDVTVPGTRVPVLGVTLLAQGQLTDLVVAGVSGQRLVTRDGQPTLVQQYDLGGRASAEVTVGLGADRVSRWRVTLTNRDPKADIVHVDFPRLAGLRMGRRGDDDWLFISKVNGNLFKNPAQCPSLINASNNYARAHAFDFIEMWDAKGGLYVGCHDPEFRDTGLPISKTDDTSVGLTVRQWTRIQPGTTWASSDRIVMPHSGDWHVGADFYREWVQRHVKPLAGPRWVKEEFDAWDVRTATFFSMYGFHGIVKTLEKNRPYGIVDIMANRQGFDTNVGFCGLCPAPNPTWGGEALFAQANRMVKERGGHTYFYINWHLWNGQYGRTPRIGRNARVLYPKDGLLPDYAWYKQNAVRRPNGSVALGDPLQTYEEHPMCPAATGWQQYHAFWAGRYAKHYNATGIYWDCLNAGYYPCYATDHGHPDLGQWGPGSRHSLAQSNAAAQAVEPHTMCSGEGIAPVVTSEFCHVYIADHNFSSFQLARYVAPRLILVGGPWDAVSPKPAEILNWTHWQFLHAVRYMGLSWNDVGVRTMRLRRAVKALLYPATFRDDVGLSLTMPAGWRNPPPAPPVAPPDQRFTTSQAIAPQAMGFWAKHLRLERPGTAVTILCLVNTTGKTDGAVRLAKAECPAVRVAWRVDWDGRWSRVAVADETSAWRVPVTSAGQSHVILVERCEPLVEVLADAYAVKGESLSVRVRVRNLNPTPIAGRITLAVPDGFKAGEASIADLEPGDMAERTLTLDVPASGDDRRVEFDAVVTTAQGTARRLKWVWVGPPVRLGIDEKPDGTGLVVHVENKSATPVSGHCRVKPNKGLVTPTEPVPFGVAARQTRDVDLPIGVRPELELPTLARIDVTTGGRTRELVYQVQPTVVNGGFEVDLAGNGQPDYWTMYGLAGIARYDLSGLDREVKHTGRQSLWLAPQPNPGRPMMAYGLHLRAFPGRRYRVRAAIRREKAGDVYALVNGQPIGRKGKPGRWEVFETIVSASVSRWMGKDVLPTLTVMLLNHSAGRAWFDSITAEVVK